LYFLPPFFTADAVAGFAAGFAAGAAAGFAACITEGEAGFATEGIAGFAAGEAVPKAPFVKLFTILETEFAPPLCVQLLGIIIKKKKIIYNNCLGWLTMKRNI
jgi:hypothetical protein